MIENLDGEIWKDVNGYNGNYQISNKGRLKSLYKGEEHLMKPGNSRGYLKTVIGRKTVSIHRLVAEAFIPNMAFKKEVNHIDGNKKNNCVENLEWVTHMENMRHANRTGLVKHKRVLTRYQIHELRVNYIPRDEKYGAKAYGQKYGIDESSVSRIAAGQKYTNDTVELSGIVDGWCVCDRCGKRNFKITENAFIEDFYWKCEKCGNMIKVNTKILPFSQAAVENRAQLKSKNREMIPCACGCGTLILNYDAKGRPRRFLFGHGSKRNIVTASGSLR